MAKRDDYGTVYFVEEGPGGHIKIGFTTARDSGLRRASGQTFNSSLLVEVGAISGYLATEAAIKDFLQDHCIRGEWFEREPALAVYRRLDVSSLPKSFAPLQGICHSLAAAGDLLEPSKHVPDDEGHDGSLPIEFVIADDLIRSYASDLQVSRPDLPLPLKAWLVRQRGRDSPIGDLGDFAFFERAFPTVGTLVHYAEYVHVHAHTNGVYRALIDSWGECAAAVSELNDWRKLAL